MQKHNHWRWSRKATPCRWRLRLHIYFNFAKVIVNCWTWIEFLRDARKEWKMPSKRQKAGLGFAHTSFTLSTASLCCLVVVELNIQFFSTLLCCVWRSPGKLNINNLIKAVNETFFLLLSNSLEMFSSRLRQDSVAATWLVPVGISRGISGLFCIINVFRLATIGREVSHDTKNALEDSSTTKRLLHHPNTRPATSRQQNNIKIR